MLKAVAIAGRELRTYAVSPTSYVVLTAFAAIYGIFFSLAFTQSGVLNLTHVLQSGFAACVWLMLLAGPLISMGLLASETDSGTLETLLTAPVTDLEVVAGKYLASLIFCGVLWVPTLQGLVLSEAAGQPDYGPVLSSYVGLLLLSAQFMAVGLFCSSWTRSQIASAIVSFGILLALMVVGVLFRDREGSLARFMSRLSPLGHVQAFLSGVIDTRDVVYFAATSLLFLFLTVRGLESRRWR